VASYFVSRAALMSLTLFGISVVIFVMLRLVPGNITDIIFDSAGFVDTKQKQRIERELGLDQPIVTQYVRWIGGLARGDLGYAYVSEKPAIQEIAPRIPVSAKLAALALVFSTLFGVTLGVLSAVRQDTALDYVLRVVSLSGLSLPSFWLGLLILMACVQWFGWIPIYRSTPESFWKELGLLALPAAAVGFRSSALVMRLTRSSMLEVLRQDYIRTARAKGASGPRVLWRHAFVNALTPVLTILGLSFGGLFSGALITEIMFAWPGMGKMMFQAILDNDYNLALVGLLFTTFTPIVGNLVADLALVAVDPRVSLASRLR